MDGYLELRPLMTMNVTIESPKLPDWEGRDGAPIRVGLGPYGMRRVFSAKSGSFKFVAEQFRGIEGTLVPGPADYCLRDGVEDAFTKYLTVDVRGVLLVTSEPRQFAIYMHYSNCVPFDAAIIRAILDPREGLTREASRFVTQPRFEVGTYADDANTPLPDDLQRLNTVVSVAHGKFIGNTIDYEVYEIVNRMV